MSTLHAPYYADAICQVDAVLEHNARMAEETYRMRIAAPAIARATVPGQFVMVRMAERDAPLIGRALAIYDVVHNERGEPHWLDLVYLRKGRLTRAIAAAPLGTRVSLWGPLGNGFSAEPCDRLIMVAGGIGQTPMLVLGREALGTQGFGNPPRPAGWATHVELIYGARRRDLLAGVDDFRNAEITVRLCTDDGSAGERARTPDLLAARLRSVEPGERVRVATCGPEIMMERVADVCREAGVDCQVSMETPMACGIGICFSCVARIRETEPDAWDYKRTCVEGPVFDAEKIHW